MKYCTEYSKQLCKETVSSLSEFNLISLLRLYLYKQKKQGIPIEILTSFSFLFFILKFYLSVLGFKFSYTLTDEVKYLPICRTTFVFSNIMKFTVKFGVNFYSEMFIVFVSHKYHQKNLIFSIF